jgi:hypothetical protein
VQVNPEVCTFLPAFVRLRLFLDLTGVFEEGQYSSIIYGLLMLVELGTYPCNDSAYLRHNPPVLMTLTLYRRFKFNQLGDSPLMTTLCRDGVIYMLCITRESQRFLG